MLKSRNSAVRQCLCRVFLSVVYGCQSVCRLPVSFCVLCPLSFLVSVLCLSSGSFCLCPLSSVFLSLSFVFCLFWSLSFVSFCLSPLSALCLFLFLSFALCLFLFLSFVCPLPLFVSVLCLSWLFLSLSLVCPLSLFVSVLCPVSFCLCPLSCPFLCLSSVWGLSPHLLFVCRPDCLTVCLCRSPVFQSWSVFFLALCVTEVSGSDLDCVHVNCRSASNEICVSGLRD